MSPGSPTVAVVGVGSVGGYFAAEVRRAGHEVTLCVRTQFEHLVVETGGQQVTVDAQVHDDPTEVSVHDWVLLSVKAHQSEAATPWLDALCGPSSVLVVLQNGVEHVARIGPLVPDTEVLPTVVRYGGEALAPGRVRHHTYGHLYVPDIEAGRRLADLFAGSAIEVRPTAEFEKEAWSKLVTNVAANSIPAITQQRFPVFRRPAIADLARGLMVECIDVAASVGVILDRALAKSEVDRLAGLPDDVGSSMLYDRLAGRPLEFDALNGAVVRVGNRHGVPTPLNSSMVALLGAISDGSVI